MVFGRGGGGGGGGKGVFQYSPPFLAPCNLTFVPVQPRIRTRETSQEGEETGDEAVVPEMWTAHRLIASPYVQVAISSNYIRASAGIWTN